MKNIMTVVAFVFITAACTPADRQIIDDQENYKMILNNDKRPAPGTLEADAEIVSAIKKDTQYEITIKIINVNEIGMATQQLSQGEEVKAIVSEQTLRNDKFNPDEENKKVVVKLSGIQSPESDSALWRIIKIYKK